MYNNSNNFNIKNYNTRDYIMVIQEKVFKIVILMLRIAVNLTMFDSIFTSRK
jgi:hypothetical protein